VSSWFFFPNPVDQHGLSLRVSPISTTEPYLAGEYLGDFRTRVSIFNATQQPLTLMSPGDLIANLDMEFTISDPDERAMFRHSGRDLRQGLSYPKLQLQPGSASNADCSLASFGLSIPRDIGKYQMQCILKIDGKLLKSPPVAFNVIELTPKAVISSSNISLEGRALELPEQERVLASIQQVQIGNRIYLFYSRYKASATASIPQLSFRLVQLPGKVLDLKVEGAYGDRNPLTITYREHSYTKFTTKHVINSVDGRPWTAEEEKHRQERLKKLAPVPEKK